MQVMKISTNSHYCNNQMSQACFSSADPNIAYVEFKSGDVLEIFKDSGCVIKHTKDGQKIMLSDYQLQKDQT